MIKHKKTLLKYREKNILDLCVFTLFFVMKKNQGASSVNENGDNYERENNSCISWKPACQIWNMKVIYSKGQYCNGRWKCNECKLSLLHLCALIKIDLYPHSEAELKKYRIMPK